MARICLFSVLLAPSLCGESRADIGGAFTIDDHESEGCLSLLQRNASARSKSLQRDLRASPRIMPRPVTRSVSKPVPQLMSSFFAEARHGIGIASRMMGTSTPPATEDLGDIFGGASQSGGFFPMELEAWTDWAALAVVACGAIFLDQCVFRKLPATFGWHIGLTALWVLLAAAFNVYIYFKLGPRHAVSWALGYVLEWMLSMDNLFVFTLIFRVYQTPAEQIHKALFVGILGAFLMRAMFFIIVAYLLDVAFWIHWPFGLLLIYSGIEAARDTGDDFDVKNTRLMRMLYSCLGSRIHQAYGKDAALWIWDADTDRLKVTYLLVVVASLEFTDIMFAMDSVTAKIAQIPDEYVSFSSTVLAMFGLRALFFVIKDLVEMFDLLKYGLSVVLVFIGLQLMLRNYVEVPASCVMIVIGAAFTICITGSIYSQGRSTMNPAA